MSAGPAPRGAAAGHDPAPQPAAVDATLRSGEPGRDRLDDGFSPPDAGQQPAPPDDAAPALGAKSPF